MSLKTPIDQQSKIKMPVDENLLHLMATHSGLTPTVGLVSIEPFRALYYDDNESKKDRLLSFVIIIRSIIALDQFEQPPTLHHAYSFLCCRITSFWGSISCRGRTTFSSNETVKEMGFPRYERLVTRLRRQRYEFNILIISLSQNWVKRN